MRRTATMHHHGYLWLGSGYELAKDGPRRPGHPEFPTARVVPLELAHWLLKPRPFVQGTWDDPDAAAAWFGQRAREHASAFATAHDRDVERIAGKVESARRAAAGGEDVAGGWYLTGQRFLSVCLVACDPHPARREFPCPER
ncbi:hypothetical protein [Streptomyces pactum]|uniref:hypothetical protein n=1 Tax=Streptomyces pactum TaxID=68249 RepID=UPI0036F94A37